MGKETNAGTPLTLEEALSLIEKQNKTIQEQNEMLAEQSKHIEKLETKVATGQSQPTVTISKKTYLVNSGTRANGKNYSAAELAEDENLCKEILKIEGQQVLTLEEE
jgi:predicted metal-dependent hydrolase